MTERKRRKPIEAPKVERPTARQEMMLLLFKGLSAHQQREEIIRLRAMFEANEVSRRHLNGKPLRAASNEAVRAAYKDTPAPGAKRKKKPGRDLGDAMGDFLDD